MTFCMQAKSILYSLEFDPLNIKESKLSKRESYIKKKKNKKWWEASQLCLQIDKQVVHDVSVRL